MMQAATRAAVDAPDHVQMDLHVAVDANDVAGARTALSKGADPNARVAFVHSSESDTALVRAARKAGSAEVVALLLSAGAGLDGRSDDGYETSVLGLAAGIGDVEVCRLLIEGGASASELVQADMTALHVAANNGHADVCRYLIEAGADPFVLTDSERTALHLAAMNNEVGCCRVLVEHGASASYLPEEHNEFYLTPFQIALRYGRVRAATFFVERCGEDPAQCTVSGVPVLELPVNDAIKSAMKNALLSVKVALVIDSSLAASGDGPRGWASKRSSGMSPI